MKKIPYAGPWIDAADVKAVAQAVEKDWYGHANDTIKKFEEAFARHTQREYAVALPSCTSAIHLALLAMGLSENDEVIVPESTWIATTAPIAYVGSKLVLVDVCSNHWCITPKTAAAGLTNNTKVIIGVDLYGSMPRWSELERFAKQNNIFLIEDAAEAIGSSCQGRPAGNFGDISVFSFHGSKTMTTGEGGMLVTNNEKLYARVLFFRDHGRTAGDTEFFNTEIGYKYKMSAMQAALGLSQLKKLDKLVKKKRQIFQWYQQYLSGEDVKFNAEPTGVVNSYWMSTIILGDGCQVSARQLRIMLDEQGVGTRPFFHPISSLPAYSEQIKTRQTIALPAPNAHHLADRGLNLPSALCLEEEDVQYICEIIKKALYHSGVVKV